MTHADDFDDLYKEVRDRLLVEAYALTGDLHVSRTAVRDAFAAAWHHWHKVRHLRDKEAWLRPLVWRRARHRHTARPWHKEKDVTQEVVAILEALSTLTSGQRKALVLTHLTPLPTSDVAREIGVPVADAEEHARSGAAAFAEALEAPDHTVGARLDVLRAVEGGHWPRSTILRRAGTARRRTHTLAGVVVTVVAVVASGMVVAQGETGDAALSEQGFERRATQVEAEEDLPTLADDVLLQPDQVRRVDRRLDWAETATHDNEDGDGLVLPCQQLRFAAPERVGALVRFFEGTEQPARGRDKGRKQRSREPQVTASAIEAIELAPSEEAAAEAFATSQGWFAGCTADRTQLLAVHDVRGVADEARLFTMRSWTGPTRTIRVGLARSGQLLTTTVDSIEGLDRSTDASAAMLAAAVNATCGTPGAGACASPPKVRSVKVPMAGVRPGMLSEFDLPPVSGAAGPWVGTSPEPARTNAAATRCDRTAFDGKGLRNSLTRTFLFPQGRRTDEFGLTQSLAATASPKAGRRFVAQVRERVGRCAEEGFGTEVDRLLNQTSEKSDLTVWRLELDISDQESVEFLMAIMRHGRTVAQVGFTPARDRSMSRDDFTWVSRRALERLPRLVHGQG